MIAVRSPAMARALPLLAIVVAIISVQFSATFAKRLFPVIGAEGATSLRLVLAAIILCAVLRPWRRWPSRLGAGALLGYGLALGGMNLLFYMSLRTVPLGIAVALEFAGPLGVGLLGARRVVDFAWAALAAAGLAVLLPIGPVATVDPAGAMLALAAGLCWALYIVFGHRAGAEFGAATTAIGAVIAALVTLPIGLAHAGPALFTVEVLAAGLVLAVMASALPNALEMFAMTRMPAQAFGTLMSAEPAGAALIGLALLDERLAPLQWLAIGAIVAASAGTTLTIRPPAEVPD